MSAAVNTLSSLLTVSVVPSSLVTVVSGFNSWSTVPIILFS